MYFLLRSLVFAYHGVCNEFGMTLCVYETKGEIIFVDTTYARTSH